MRSLPRHLFAGIALSVSILAASSTFAANPASTAPLADKIPGTAVLYVGWAGTTALQPAYAKSKLKGLIDATNFPKNLSDTIGDLLTRYAPPSGTTDGDRIEHAKGVWNQLQGLQKYPIAFFMMPVDATQQNPDNASTLGLVLDAGADGDAVAAKLHTLLESAPPKVKLERQGTLFEITAGAPLPATFAPLSASADFKKTLAAAPTGPITNAYVQYVDAGALFNSIKAGIAAKATGPEGAKATTGIEIMTALGLDKIGHGGSHGGFTDAGWEDSSFLELGQPRTGLLAAVTGAGVSDDDFLMVPQGATVVGVSNLDLNKVWTTIRDTLHSSDANVAKQMDDYLGHVKDNTGIEVDKLAAAFGSKWVFYKVEGGNFVAMNSLSDGATASAALDTMEKFATDQMAGRAQIAFRSTEIDGITVKYVQVQTQQIAYAVIDNKLYLASTPRLLVKATKPITKEQSILANADFVSMRKDLAASTKGGPVLSMTYNDLRKTVPEMLFSARMLLGMANMFGAGISSDLIPTAEQVTPFLEPSGSVIWSDASGMHFYDRGPFPGAQSASTKQITPSLSGADAMVTSTLEKLLVSPPTSSASPSVRMP